VPEGALSILFSTLRGHQREVFEPLGIERHQRLQTVGVGG